MGVRCPHLLYIVGVALFYSLYSLSLGCADQAGQICEDDVNY